MGVRAGVALGAQAEPGADAAVGLRAAVVVVEEAPAVQTARGALPEEVVGIPAHQAALRQRHLGEGPRRASLDARPAAARRPRAAGDGGGPPAISQWLRVEPMHMLSFDSLLFCHGSLQILKKNLP